MAKSQPAWRSPWMMGLILLGMVFVGANMYLIWLAGSHSPDLVVDNYYERGQDYEKNMLKRLARDPGWEMELVPPQQIELNQASEFIFTLQGKEGSVVNPDSVILYAYRPNDADADFSVPMVELSAGHYQADVNFPLKGVWDLLATVKHGQDEYHVAHRVHVAP